MLQSAGNREFGITNLVHASQMTSGSGRAGLDQVVQSLAAEMPLRIASAMPNDTPSLASATIRLRRFVSFYPAFSAALLTDREGTVIACSEVRNLRGLHLPLDGVAAAAEEFGIVSFSDETTAEVLAQCEGDSLVAASVRCPRGDSRCGMLICRTHA